MVNQSAKRLIGRLPYGYACGRLVSGQDGRILDCIILDTNDIFEEILGVQANSARGISLLEFLGYFQNSDFSETKFCDALTDFGYAEIKDLCAVQSGRFFSCDAYLPDRNTFAFFIRDTNDSETALQKLAAEKIELETAKADLDFIFNSTQDAMFMAEYIDGEFYYCRINSAHEKLSGFSNSDIKGKTPIEAWGEPSGRILHELYLSGINSKETLVSEEILVMDGVTRHFLTSLVSVFEQGHRYLIVSRKDMTTYKHLQESHNALLQRLESMFMDHSAIMLVIDPDTGKILDANPSACRYYGYDKFKLLSLNIQDINMLPVEDTAKLRLQAFEKAKGHFIFPHRLNGGEIRLVEVYSCPVGSKHERQLYSIIFDVTDREMYKENLNGEKELLNTTLKSIGDGVVTTDTESKITYINKAAEDIVLWSNEDAIGRDFTEVFILKNEESGETVENPVEKVLQMKKVIGIASHTVLVNKKNELISIADSAAPIKNEDGKIFGVVIVFRDIRVEKAHQDKILHLSYHDSLTGLYNRRFIELEIYRLDAGSALPVSVIMGDVNGLKIANDIFSHETGDQLLKKVSEAFEDCCGATDIVARWGGDEFLMLMPGSSLERAETMIRRLKERFEKKSAGTLQLSVSLGCATKTEETQPLRDVVHQAEDWMYHQKMLEGKSYRSTIINTLLATLYEKSMETEEHAQRLMTHCQAMGEKIGLSDKALNELALLSVLHDIGKVGVQQDILKKPGSLDVEEWKEMKKHPEIGYRIAQNTPELIIVAEHILSHHERWDGNGYPNGLIGENIPINCRILAVADAFDAMTNDRVYRKALCSRDAIQEILNNAGTQFDPNLVDIFVETIPLEKS